MQAILQIEPFAKVRRKFKKVVKPCSQPYVTRKAFFCPHGYLKVVDGLFEIWRRIPLCTGLTGNSRFDVTGSKSKLVYTLSIVALYQYQLVFSRATLC